jgi:hypothetical protein
MKFFNRPSDENGKQVIICGKGENDPTLPVVDFQAVVGHFAPIGEIPASKGRRALVHRRPDSVCQPRFPAVGTNNDPRLFGYDLAAWVASPADTRQAIVLGEKVFGKESLSQL